MNILPVAKLHRCHVACDMYRFLKNRQYNIDFPRRQEQFHQYPTRGGRQFHLPRTNLQVTANAFNINGPKVWNSIPEEVKCAPSLETFKAKLKVFLKETDI